MTLRKTLYNINEDERRNNYLCFCSENYTHRINITFFRNKVNIGNNYAEADDTYFKITRVKRHKYVDSLF